MTRLAIFDYGCGNLFGLKAALERSGAEARVVSHLKGLARFHGLVLPGVGNFAPAAATLRRSRRRLISAVAAGMPVLGICLGMQLLFERSEEGDVEGLGILGGDVVALPARVKVPHMGWNTLQISLKSRLLYGIKDTAWFYFVHSFRVKPSDGRVVAATCEYGARFPAAVERANLFGTQFHPEKSGSAGGDVLRNFLEEIAE